MGFELVDLDEAEAVQALRDMDPAREPLQPQQLLIADALNAGRRRAVFEIPRRASKTTTILCWCLGRCVSRPRYKVTFSAQTGMAGVSALDEWARDGLDRINPPDDGDTPPWQRGRPRKPKAQVRAESLFGLDVIPFEESAGSSGRGFRVLKGNTKTGIYFDNGSSFTVIRPEAGAYRGKAADVSWLDEAQEIEPTEGDALLAGILPLQDTRPDSMIVVSGTAGEERAGPLWAFLAQLRSGSERMGGLDFAVPEETPWEEVEDVESAMTLVERVHPGVGTLTTLDAMRDNWGDIPRPQWAREYLSWWPETFGSVVIDPEQWAAGYLAKQATRPARVAFGYSVKPRGGAAAFAAAWRSSTGIAYIETVEHRVGSAWMPVVAQGLTTKYRGSTIGYDDMGEGKTTATEMDRLKPKPRLQVITYAQRAAGSIQILRDIERGTLRHPQGDLSLNAAAEIIAKREVRNESGMFLFTPAVKGGDITAFDAATNALRNWDQHFARRQGGSSAPIMGD